MMDHISVSQMNVYLMCPLKYRFNYIDKLPKPFKSAELAMGSAIHSAIEWWHKQRLNGVLPEWKQVARIFEADIQAQAMDEIRYKNGDDLESLLTKGRELLAVYLKEFPGRKPASTEQPFRVPLVDLETGEELDLPLDGYFDLIEEEDTVVELKTAAKAYDQTTILQHLQLTAYAYAYQMLYKRPANLRLDVLIKSKNVRLQSFDVGRDKEDMVRFFHITKGVSRAIEDHHFYPNEGWQCPTCEFSNVCRKWRT
jgi:putative RecB family exonuclease